MNYLHIEDRQWEGMDLKKSDQAGRPSSVENLNNNHTYT